MSQGAARRGEAEPTGRSMKRTLMIDFIFVGLAALMLLSTISLLAPAQGHVRYILNETEVRSIEARSPLLRQSDVLGPQMLGFFLLVAAVQFSGLVLARHPISLKVISFASSFDPIAVPLLRVVLGAFLIASGLTGKLFTPQLGFELGAPRSLVSVLELGAGLLLMFGFLTRVAAVFLLILIAHAFLLLGLHGLDQLYLLGLALFFLIESGGRFSADGLFKGQFRRFFGELPLAQTWAVPILRALLGITLIWLGVTEKLVGPELTAYAITKFGVPYYPELSLFVFLFGIGEIFLGFHFLLGLFMRLASIGYLFLLVSAFFLFGESVNHLALFAITLFFVIRGAGPYHVEVSLAKAPLPSGNKPPS